MTFKSKLKKFKVLVGSPVADRKDYCFPQWLAMANTLTYGNYDLFLADNSDSRKNFKNLMREGIAQVKHIRPKQKSSTQYLAESHEAIRQRTLDMGYEYLLHLESDIFPPADIIERLIAHEEGVVGAMYPIDFGHDSHILIQDVENKGTIRETTNVKSPYDITRVTGKLERVYNVGLGCILIHRSVLEKIKFRHEPSAYIHPDSLFAMDLNALNIPIYLDTNIVCEHKNSEWIFG